MQVVSRYLATTDSGRAECKTDDKGHATKEWEINLKLLNRRKNEDKRLAVNHVESIVVQDQTLQSGSERFPIKIGFKTEVNGLEEGEKEDSSFVVLRDTPPEVNKSDEKLGTRTRGKDHLPISGHMNNLPRRASKRLTRAEADLSPQVKTRNKANAEACDAETSSDEKAVKCDTAK